MDVYREGDIEVVKIGPLGPYGNNAYIIADAAAKQSKLGEGVLARAPRHRARSDVERGV